MAATPACLPCSPRTFALSDSMSNVPANPAQSWPERYSAFVEEIITDTMKGRIASKEQVYRRLNDALEGGVGEIFSGDFFFS